MYEAVTPAKAGVQEMNRRRYWIPAFAGMTEFQTSSCRANNEYADLHRHVL